MRSAVVLVPGLWMPGAALALLAARVRRAGFDARVFRYPGRASVEDNIARLAQYCERLRDPALGFVGHSLGGVLVFQMLARRPDIASRAALLIGSPVRGCRAGRLFGATVLGRRMIGRSAPLWAEQTSPPWTRPEPLGVIAGTLPVGLGRLLYRLPAPNDGVVGVSETEVSGMRERALVPVGHSGLIFSRRVANLTVAFLGKGHFG